MYKNRSQGFTLIELLVVIAIIGILSAVVLASLNTARVKGNNAAIQSNLSTIQTQAEVYYGDNTVASNTYGTASDSCSSGMFADKTIAKAIGQAKTANGNTALVCHSTAQAYVVSSVQAGSSAKFWCVDSKGITGESASAGGSADTGCP